MIAYKSAENTVGELSKKILDGESKSLHKYAKLTVEVHFTG